MTELKFFLLTFFIIFISLTVLVKVEHKWDVNLEEAKNIRIKLRKRAVIAPLNKKITSVYISPKHKINFEDARKVILNLIEQHKIPEALRIWDKRSRKLRDT